MKLAPQILPPADRLERAQTVARRSFDRWAAKPEADRQRITGALDGLARAATAGDAAGLDAAEDGFYVAVGEVVGVVLEVERRGPVAGIWAVTVSAVAREAAQRNRPGLRVYAVSEFPGCESDPPRLHALRRREIVLAAFGLLQPVGA